ncbi:uncharacterized protein CDV56_102492 [Aspergillus thermomutatus]|uniref:Uncharacterized protein n=1 Tax=Aspergillus thermomutatus TaxID=41047 RepID=A0A397GXW5_ASPTH|nr:uncharacterized protein CDV56_102492 [Aspergillus thermomutatus]RHZ55497.1 hypothetical protein CDV56_102492 [Aspergillus thermomutatus]
MPLNSNPSQNSSVPPLISRVIHLTLHGLQPSKNRPPPVRSFSTAQRSAKPGKRIIVTHPLLDILARYHVVGVGYWEKGERATKVERDLGDVEGLHGGSGFELLSLSVRGV